MKISDFTESIYVFARITEPISHLSIADDYCVCQYTVRKEINVKRGWPTKWIMLATEFMLTKNVSLVKAVLYVYKCFYINTEQKDIGL